VQEMTIAIRKRGEEYKEESLTKVRTNAINSIEREMTEKGLTAQDLGSYSNYQARINSLTKV